MLLPDNPPDAVYTDDDEFDFSDVFGPLPGQLSVEVNEGNLETEVLMWVNWFMIIQLLCRGDHILWLTLLLVSVIH